MFVTGGVLQLEGEGGGPPGARVQKSHTAVSCLIKTMFSPNLLCVFITKIPLNDRLSGRFTGSMCRDGGGGGGGGGGNK